jgi:hypothetical protein
MNTLYKICGGDVGVKRLIVLAVSLVLCFSIIGINVFADGVPEEYQKYIGKTYWVKTYLFGEKIKPFVMNLNNKKILLNKKECYTKIKVIGYAGDTWVGKFTIEINNNQYLTDGCTITLSKSGDYSRLEEDPKALFKFSTNIWNKLSNLNPFIGMTHDMLTIIRGNPIKIKTTHIFTTKEQWTYRNGLSDEYYYFKNGNLTSWKK